MLVALGAFWAPRALAQEEPPAEQEEAAPAPAPENVESATRARTYFLEGMELFQRREFLEAQRRFELAAQLVPSADLWFNIARTHEELRQPGQAAEYYERYLRDRVDPPDRAQVESRVAALREQEEAARLARRRAPTTGTLRVRSNVEGAEIAVGGQGIGRTPVVAPLSLSPGRHELTLEREGYVPFRSEVRLEAGVDTAAYADLVPQTQYRAIRGRRIFTWVATALAVGSLGGAIGTGVHAQGIAGDAQDFADMGMQEQALSTFEDSRRWGAVSDYFLGGAIALGIGAIVLYFVEGRSVGTEELSPEEALEAAE